MRRRKSAPAPRLARLHSPCTAHELHVGVHRVTPPFGVHEQSLPCSPRRSYRFGRLQQVREAAICPLVLDLPPCRPFLPCEVHPFRRRSLLRQGPRLAAPGSRDSPPVNMEKRAERPKVGDASVRSRNGVPYRKGCVVNGQMTKVTKNAYAPLRPHPGKRRNNINRHLFMFHISFWSAKRSHMLVSTWQNE